MEVQVATDTVLVNGRDLAVYDAAFIPKDGKEMETAPKIRELLLHRVRRVGA